MSAEKTSPAREYEYAGTPELRAMEVMKRYNRAIVRRFYSDMLSTCQIPAHAHRVCEFGGGIGTLALEFFRMSGLRPIVVEPDKKQRRVLAERGLVARRNLSEVSESFTFIFSSNVLEHLQDDIAALAEIRRKLVVGGVTAIYVPAFPILWNQNDRKVEHLRRYSIRGLECKLRTAGFRVLKANYIDSLGFFITLLYKMLGSRHGRLDEKMLRFYDGAVFPVSQLADVLLGGLLGKNLYILAQRS